MSRISAQVAVFREASGHCCGRWWWLLLRVVNGFLVAGVEEQMPERLLPCRVVQELLVREAWVLNV